MSSSTNLSALILAHEATELLFRAAESVSWADELIIVAQGDIWQKDEYWQQLASRTPFRLLKSEQPVTDFAHLRNWAADQASHDWILFLDSDEVLAQDGAKAINNFLSQDVDQIGAFLRQDVFLGQPLHHGEVGQVFIPRLYNRQSASYLRPVHEVLTPHTDLPIVTVPTNLTHFAHHSLSEFISSVNQYTQIEAEYRHHQGRSTSLLEILLFPLGKFIHNYLLKLGWRDGWRGLIYAWMMSYHSLWVRIKLYEKNHSS